LVEDVATIALAYWLFRGGLRTRGIKDALATEQLKALRQRLVSPEVIETEAERIRFLVSWRVVKPKVKQKVALEEDFAGVERTLEPSREFGFLVIPIGRLLRELAERIRKS
jgi:hypothetical protein